MRHTWVVLLVVGSLLGGCAGAASAIAGGVVVASGSRLGTGPRVHGAARRGNRSARRGASAAAVGGGAASCVWRGCV